MTPSADDPRAQPCDAPAVAQLLTEIGQRLELAAEAPFKVRAYYRAAETLLALPVPLAELVAKGRLRELPGIGEALAEKITKLHKTGTHPTLEYLREQMPAGVLDLLRIPGLGPKKAAILFTELHVSNLAELEEACRAERLRACKGLGAALEMKVLHGLKFLHKTEGLRLVNAADEHVRLACESLRTSRPELRRVLPAGALRRGCELVDSLCVVAELPEGGGRETSITAGEVRVFLSSPQHYGVRLLFATGSQAHLDGLCARAASQGLRLSEKGFLLGRKGREIPCPDEATLYAALGLPFIAPELREGQGEIEQAAAGALPALLQERDIRGILHCHTQFSDGADTLAAMAEATRARGFQYFGVADHSQSAFYAGGLKDDAIRAQHKLADELNAGYGAGLFRIFKGIESDIREDGALDYPAPVLQSFDFIVASVHSRFNLDQQAQTKRIIGAVENPHTTMLGHPSGRLLLQREAYPVDLEEVLQACAKHGVVVELNAHPHRLDLDWRWHRRALELGCMLSINPDAHSSAELDVMRWGVAVARKGGVPRERVLNCMDLRTLADWFAARRKRAQ